MDNYEQDIFYKVDGLTLEQKRDLLIFAKENCNKWHVDILDARKSWSREKVEISFEEILKKLDEDCHYVFIHRRGFKDQKGKPLGDCEYVLEIGFTTMRDPAYYLFIYCNEKKLSRFITKYHLEKHIQ